MRKTTRITWLLQLLSLSFLFPHSACSVNGTDGNTTASNISDNVTVTVSAQNTVITTVTTLTKSSSESAPSPNTALPPTDDAGKKDNPTQRLTSAQPAAVATTLTATGPLASNTAAPTQQPNTPGNTATPVINTVPTTVKDAATPKTTPSPSHTTLVTTRSDSSGPLVGATNAATVAAPVATTPGKTSGTTSPATLYSNNNVGTTQNTKAPDAPPTSQRSMADTSVTARTGQEGSQGGSGTDKMTVTDRSLKEATTEATQPPGNMGSTSSPSTPAKAGPSATVRIFTAKAGPTLTTPTPKPTPGHRIPSISTARTTTTISRASPELFSYSLNKGVTNEREEDEHLEEVCKRLLANFKDGNCSVTYDRRNGKIQFGRVEINGEVKASIATEHYNEINKKPADNKTLIAILASCGALLIMIVILAVCASHHRKPYSENQQHLTEELHTVENGYHDNPTLEVMEVQPEMQEKKTAMNGEFNDSWIVPIDNLLKEDIPDEEDTHL